jgi:hypothetical protein
MHSDLQYLSAMESTRRLSSLDPGVAQKQQEETLNFLTTAHKRTKSITTQRALE